MIEIRAGRCSRREIPARNGRVGVHPVTTLIERGIDLVQRGCGLHRRPRSLLVPNCRINSPHLLVCRPKRTTWRKPAPRRLVARRLELDVTDAAREWLARFAPLCGARPLRRLVQSAIGDQLARKLLAGEIRDGDTVRVDLDAAADRLTVTRA